MTKKTLLSAILFVGFIFAGQAQNVFNQLAIGVDAGTYGPGVTLPVWILKCWPMVSLSLSYRIF